MGFPLFLFVLFWWLFYGLLWYGQARSSTLSCLIVWLLIRRILSLGSKSPRGPFPLVEGNPILNPWLWDLIQLMSLGRPSAVFYTPQIVRPVLLGIWMEESMGCCSLSLSPSYSIFIKPLISRRTIFKAFAQVQTSYLYFSVSLILYRSVLNPAGGLWAETAVLSLVKS